MNTRIYLRASTNEQDATRARLVLHGFAESHRLSVVGEYVEHESGAKLERPELMRLLDESDAGDILLIEKVDRISRLDRDDWDTLKARIKASGVRLVVLCMPTSHKAIEADQNESWIYDIINDLLLELAAEQSRDDYETRRERQAQGIAKAKADGKYKGRAVSPETIRKVNKAEELLARNENLSIKNACRAVGISFGSFQKHSSRYI